MIFIFATDIHLSSVTPGSRIDKYDEAVFKKIEYMFQRANELGAPVLLGGDLFMTPTQPDYIKNRLKALILEYKVRVLSIVGNHDLLWYNVDYIERTSFQSLVMPGVIEYLCDYANNEVTIGGVRIIGHEFGKEFPVVDDRNTIIISHSFYSYGKDKLDVSRHDVAKSGAGYICFGHDHNQYNVEENNGTLVVRPGALTRGTSHTENRVRQVGFAVIDTDSRTVTYEAIPFAAKFQEVFREKYEVERERNPVSFEEIQQFIDELRNAKLEVNPFDILIAMEKSQRITELCTYYLESVGLIRSAVV